MIQVDARGDQCPIPVIKTKKAVESLTGADTVEVLVDNETALQNVTKLGSSYGAKVASSKTDDGAFRITIEVSAEAAGKTACAAADGEGVHGDTVAVISSDCMGSGSDELGRILIKGFIFALTQLPEPPKTILFYNGGVRLSTEGSDSLEDLKKMEAAGTVIMSCGTCLDYYKLKEKLAVGSVTNMYVITETMAKAGRILRP